MKINYLVLQAGKKRAVIENAALEIADVGTSPTLEILLRAVVAQQVAAFHDKFENPNLFPFLAPAEIAAGIENGKIGFGVMSEKNEIDVAAAQEIAVQAFEDGMFSVFVDEEEIRNLSDNIDLREDTVICFIRLTFLAGGFW